jgi:hypothetical protein
MARKIYTRSVSRVVDDDDDRPRRRRRQPLSPLQIVGLLILIFVVLKLAGVIHLR